MSKEVTQERPAETTIKDGRKWGKNKSDRERKKENRWDARGEAVQRSSAIRELEEKSKEKDPERQITCTESQAEKAFQHLK